MIDSMQMALIKKDIRGITSNKRMFSVLLIVPLVMTVFMPTVFILSVALAPTGAGDFQEMLALLPGSAPQGDIKQMVIGLILDNIIPIFFLLIPIMAASVMAASSFVGEKEKRTLETLLYCPLSLGQIFSAKILASFALSMLVSLLSFAAMIIVVETELFFVTGAFIFPGISWLVLLLLVSPGASLAAIALIVRGSAKARTMEESQQRSVFLILPIMILVFGQFTGVMLLSVWLLLGLGVLLAAAALLLIKKSFACFTYETLLK